MQPDRLPPGLGCHFLFYREVLRFLNKSKECAYFRSQYRRHYHKISEEMGVHNRLHLHLLKSVFEAIFRSATLLLTPFFMVQLVFRDIIF